MKNEKIFCEAAFCLKVHKIYKKKKKKKNLQKKKKKKKTPGSSAERVRKFSERLKTDPKLRK